MITKFKNGFLLAITTTRTEVTAGAAWISALWTFPSVLASAILIAWGAEAAQFLISQGLALAILAWLQTLPEFAVEAVIAHEAARDPQKIHLVTANFTGSLRLLTGLGWPMIYATAAIFHRKRQHEPIREIVLEDEHSIEVVGLVISILYFVWIYIKGSLDLWDSIVLIVIYGAYLYVLRKIPARDEEEIQELEAIPRKILSFSKPIRNSIIVGLFIAGGMILYFVAHPFLESMLAVALSLGVSEFVFVQWVSPFLSEFPEKVSAFHWARQPKKAPMALMNMVSSNINQWTMLIAMIPFVYSYGIGSPSAIHFDLHQKEEILLTLAQAFVGFMLLLNMSFSWYEAAGLFVLWLAQFVQPHWRVEITYIYFAWFGVEVIRLFGSNRSLPAITHFGKLFKQHVLGKGL
jgi:cation:H+ antiporter